MLISLLQLPVEDYVKAMELLTNDFRFRLYTVCYRRLIIAWLILASLVLIGILSSGLKGLVIFAVVLVWLFILGLGVVGCIFGKQYVSDMTELLLLVITSLTLMSHNCSVKISTGLQQSVMCSNRILMPLHLLLGVEDRGKISCHKIGVITTHPLKIIF